jgi:MYXO-CTERM domain-containing protein
MAVVSILAGVVTVPATASAATPHTVRLAFDGGEIESGKDNASIPRSSCFGLQGEWPAFAGSVEDREAIVAQVEEYLAPFDVRVVTEVPPPEVPHDLVLIGGKGGDYALPGGDGYTCVVDCLDDWRRNVSAVYSEEIGDEPTQIATAIVHELGHAWGLDHVEGPEFIMYRHLSSDPQHWADGCTPLGDGQWCADAKVVECGDVAQDSKAELLARFGPPSVDEAPPTIEFVSPEDGALVSSGHHELKIVAGDDRGGYGWHISSHALDWNHAAWDADETSVLVELPPGPGVYEFEAVITDQAGKQGFASLTLEVPEDAAPSEPMWTEDEGDGCGCRSKGEPGGGWGLVSMLWMVRRRRPGGSSGECLEVRAAHRSPARPAGEARSPRAPGEGRSRSCGKGPSLGCRCRGSRTGS